MSRHALLLVVLLALLSLPSSISADEPAASAPPSPPQWIVLRNGEALQGSLTSEGDRLRITIDGGEIRLSAREVDFVCASLDEAYRLQCRRIIVGRIEDHLDLAQWCLRQGLLGYTAQQISAAMAIDPRNPRLARLDDRLQQALDQAAHWSSLDAPADQPKSSVPLKADDLDRFARTLPADTLEQFVSKIQPLLSNHCATAGCHGAGSTSSYSLVRPPQRKTVPRHLTLRNLHNTLERVNFGQPEESAVLRAAREPHGSASGAVFEAESKQYEELREWVAAAVGRAGAASTIATASQSSNSSASTQNAANLDATPGSLIPHGK